MRDTFGRNGLIIYHTSIGYMFSLSNVLGSCNEFHFQMFSKTFPEPTASLEQSRARALVDKGLDIVVRLEAGAKSCCRDC